MIVFLKFQLILDNLMINKVEFNLHKKIIVFVNLIVM